MPPGGIPGAPLGSGLSATIPLVVINSPATKAAFLARYPHDLGRIDDPGRHHVLVVARLCVITEIWLVLVGQLADHDRAFDAGILGDLPYRPLDRFADDVNPDLLVVVRGVESGQNLAGKEQRYATAGDHTLLHRGLGCVHGVVDAVLALLDLDLAAAADADDRDATR